jgi:hypothetical protein
VSWSNPTPEEAQESYDSAVSRYNTAAEDYYAAKSELESTYGNWQGGQRNLDVAYYEERQAKDAESRIVHAIKMLSDGDYADQKIEEANSVAGNVWEALDGCVSCSGMNIPRSLLIFKTSRVPDNSHSAKALELFKAERDALEEQIREIIRREQSLIAYIEEQEAKMERCLDVMNDAGKTMNATALDMEHYGKYIEE